VKHGFSGLFLMALVGAAALAQDAATFEAASIKPSLAEPGSSSAINTERGRIAARNVTLKRCIRGAYDIPESNILGGEKWADEDRFDIDAKADSPAGDHELMLMLRALLADRFKLTFHRESRPLAGYALVAAKGGIKAKPAPPGTPSAGTSRRGGVDATACSMSCLAMKLSEAIHAPVVDETKVQGLFNFNLQWTPGDMDVAVFSAIQEQAGLQLKGRKVPTDVIVIDRAERPAAN